MNDRGKSTRDKTQMKNIEQDIFKLNVDENEPSFDEKFFKQQDQQIIKSEVFFILCENFSNVQITEFMTSFEKKFDKRFNQHVNSFNVKINVIENQFVTIINAHAEINKRLNEFFNIDSFQRLLVNQIFQQKSSASKRSQLDKNINNHKLFDDDDHNESNNSTSSLHRRTLFDLNSIFYDSVFYNFEFFDLIEYIFKVVQSSLKALIVEQINYFDFKKKSKTSNITVKNASFFFDSMITMSKHTYYKNVYMFVNRLKN